MNEVHKTVLAHMYHSKCHLQKFISTGKPAENWLEQNKPRYIKGLRNDFMYCGEDYGSVLLICGN